MSGNSGKQRKQKKENKGTTFQHETKTKTTSAVTHQTDTSSHIHRPMNNTSDILGQSRTILYGPGENQLSFCGQGGGIVYSGVPAQGGNTQINSAQMMSLNNNQGQHVTGIQIQPNMINSMNTGMNNGANNGMPPWAAVMSQQLQSIQGQLETQNMRWQQVEGQLQNQNVRMNNMESQINQLSGLNQKMTETNITVNRIDTEVGAMKTRFDEYEKSIIFYNELCDGIIIKNTNLESRVEELSENLSSMTEKLVDVQWRSMRENLVFSGISEPTLEKGEQENCEARIKQFLYEDMRLEQEFSFDRVHRLGRFKRGQTYPRPIVAKFTYYKDKETVRQAAPKTLIGSSYSVNEQFPQEIENRRKLLYPVAKRARQNPNNKVRLVRDKLYINGAQYIPDEQEIPNGPSTSSNPPRAQQSSYRNPNSRFDNRQTRRQQADGQTYIGQHFSRGRQNTQTPAPSFNMAQGSMGAPGYTHVRNNAGGNIFSNNRFDILSQCENSDGSVIATPSCPGKMKATSPLEAELLKKQKECATSENSTNSDITMQEQSNDNDCVRSPANETDV